jgi:DNA polymerase elongation subunit (family B)
MEKSEFFSYSWHVDEDEINCTIIRIYGLNSNNETVCVIVKDFLPYAYIELPDVVEWDDSKAGLVASKLNGMLHDKKPVTYELFFKKRLYYANLSANRKRRLYPYLKCCFSHTGDIKQLGFVIRKPINIPGIGAIQLKSHEHNASPILQLTSQKKIPTAGWISFMGKRIKPENQTTYCKYEYVVKSCNLEEKKSSSIARPLLMGYDIEVNSSIPSSMPNANRPPDKIFQISCVFARQGSKPDTYERYLLTLGEPDLNLLDNIEVLMYETEHDILLGFVELLQEKQPNICIGYNIFTFDIPYMIDRAKMDYCIYDFDKQSMVKGGHAKEKIIKWSSQAYKNQEFQFLDAEGRIFVDLLPLVRRDYKMSNYQLKTIASHFLKDMTKDPLDAKAIFKCYRLGMKGGEKGAKALGIVGKYCVKDSELVVRLFETLTTWIALCEMSKVTNVPIFQLYTQGQQLKVFSQAYKKCTHENTVVENNAYVAKDGDHYVGATVFPPIPGVYDKVVPFDFSSLYPTTIIAYNISWDTLVTDDSIPDDLCHVMTWPECYGCPHDPKEIRKAELNLVIKEKDAELKELRRQRDLKKNSALKEEFKAKIAKFIKDNKPLRDERSQLNKGKPKHITCCVRHYRWLKKPMGVLPEILTNLLDTRSATKKEMKGVKAKLKELKEDSDEYSELSTYYDVLDQRQLALKVSANSGYGCMGVKKGYLPLLPGAMATTYMGRKAIEKAAESIQKDWKGVLVYGDTDSNYVNFPHLQTAQECWDYSIEVAKQVSKLFPPPMSLAYEEKIYWRFFILTKKRYMSLACERDGVLKKEINKKGVLLQRRDNCALVRKIYGDVVMAIFNKEKKDTVIDYIITELNKLCSGFYPMNDFIVTKSVGDVGDDLEEPREGKDKNDKPCWKIGDYKIKLLPTDEKKREQQFKLKKCNNVRDYYLHSLPAQVQLSEKMKERGQLVAAGSRIEYVITMNGGHLAKQYEKVEDSNYFRKHGSVLELDYLYYLKQLVNPVDQILDIIYTIPSDEKYKFEKGFMMRQYKFRLLRSKMLTELRAVFKPIIKVK